MKSSCLPTVLLFGCTNVGKSTLFNRLSRSRTAIVHDRPGVTRDCIQADVDARFQLIDCGGLGCTHDPLFQSVEQNVYAILKKAEVVVWVLDGKQGLKPQDYQISQDLRKLNKPVILAINKLDNDRETANLIEFYNLGWKCVIPISATHAINMSALKATILDMLPPSPVLEAKADVKVKFAIVGRPNVGKSSLANTLLKEHRVLVSEVAGTTRDAIACSFEWQFRNGLREKFILVDTAGIRKKATDAIEYFARLRTENMLKSVDIALILLDLLEGPTVLDKNLIRYVNALGKASLLVVNKWDLARQRLIQANENPEKFQNQFLKHIKRACAFCDAPVVFISAQSGEGLELLLNQILALHQRLQTKISTGQLNRFLHTTILKKPPTMCDGKRFKIYYAVHTQNQPFTLQLFCNRLHWMPKNYERFLEHAIRQEYNLEGCPVRLKWIEKTQKELGGLCS